MSSGEEEAKQETKTCTFTFKKNFRRAGQRLQNARRRPAGAKEKGSDSDSSYASSGTTSEDDTTVVVKKRKRQKFNPMVSSTSAGKAKTGREQREKDSSSENSSDEEAEGRSRVGVYFESTKTGERSGPSDMGATAILETETEKDRDAQAVFEKAQEVNKGIKEGKESEEVYHGLHGYKQYIEKRDTSFGNASSGGVRKGPIRAPDNLRSTVRWDYQPDICKDYKETGFCTFGDSCKFLHDRSDYKHGWQIEREVAEGRYGASEDDPGKYEISDSDDELPFKCFICKESFTDPIITKCKHYFCEKCALQHYKKSKKCYICGAQTMGVFNPAKDITARLKAEEEEAHSQQKQHVSNDEEDESD